MKSTEDWDRIHNYIKTHTWKTIPCFSGDECWCRLIQCVDIPDGEDPDDYTLNNSGSISKDIAEMIVSEHNIMLTKKVWVIDLATCTDDEREYALKIIRDKMND